MRIGPDDRRWMVLDPGAESTLADILFEGSLKDLALQLKGGLSMDSRPTSFTDRKEAESEAIARLVARQVAYLLATRDATAALGKATHLELLDSDGKPIFEAKLPPIDR